MFGVGVGTETVPDEWDEPQPESLAARLSDMPTGTELGVALSEFDREELDGFDRVLLLEARARQVAHLQAEMLADIESIARADDQPFGHREWSEFVADEIGAALHLTRRSAENWWWLASRLTRDLPQVWQAPSAGDLDLPRARVFASELEAAPDDLATRIADQVLEWASSHTTGQIASRIRRLMIAADPALAASRYEKGQGERMLLLSANPDGTANLEGLSLPADRATRAFNLIDTLAQQAKTTGEVRTLDQLRADMLLNLLEGTSRPGQAGPQGAIDIRIDLTTLAGLDEHPGEIPGWGPVVADIARRIVSEQPQSSWQVTVTDKDSGVWTGTTNRRPTLTQRRRITASVPTCVFPGCRRPSRRSDLDHNHPWHRGGQTKDRNLAPLCRHHHRVKDEGGWRLEQMLPWVFRWRSPLGHSYQVEVDPP